MVLVAVVVGEFLVRTWEDVLMRAFGQQVLQQLTEAVRECLLQVDHHVFAHRILRQVLVRHLQLLDFAAGRLWSVLTWGRRTPLSV